MAEILFRIVMVFISLWKLFHSFIIWCMGGWIKWFVVKGIFKKAGIRVNGDKPWDIQISDENIFARMGRDRTLALGESYMEGWWDCKDVAEFYSRMVTSESYNFHYFPWLRLINYLQFDLFNLQTAARAHDVILKHYDMGNIIFESFLDPYMTYSCGYWQNGAQNLDEAQIAKMHLIAQKLQLKPGMRVLDIGCGWGSLCQFLAANYKVEVVGITISEEGAKTAIQKCQGLRVKILMMDYRDLDEKFDRIVSVEMMEHVGHKNYRKYFQTAHRCLEDGGIFLVQVIATDNDKLPRIEPWFNTYIFPNGSLPRPIDITKGVNQLLTIEDWHNFGKFFAYAKTGPDYIKTLQAWHTNLTKSWPKIQHHFKDEKMAYRMWTHYFLLSAGLFKSRKYHVWQILLSKNGVPGGCTCVR